MLSLYVCSKIASLTSNEIIKLDLQDEVCDTNVLTVGNLMTTIKDKLNLTGLIDDYQLVCFGKKLKEEKPLTHYGIKSNATVHLFLKSAEERSADKKVDENPGREKKAKVDQKEMHNMVVASKTALNNSSFRQMLTRLHENDFRNNLIQCTPGLRDDPIAIAALHDHELLNILMEKDSIERVYEKHPAILEAATHLATAFHEENAMSAGRNLPSAMSVDSSPPNVSYSLDDLPEDEEMSGGVDAPPPNGQHVMSPTTASTFAHLMQQAMLASHNQAQRSQQQQPSHTLPQNPTPQQIQQLQLQQLQQLQQQHQQEQQQQQQQQGIRQPNNARIAFEMLRHALQLTEPSTSQQGNSSVPSTPSVTNNSGQSIAPPARPDMSQQIAQMREIGLTDENVCLQALYATNGDVQAAIELIFSDTFHP